MFANGTLLTADNVSTIPRRNNALFLSDYVYEQRTYTKDYIAEGLEAVTSWDKLESGLCSSDRPGELSNSLDEFLLGTPVLRARTAATIKPLVVAKLPKATHNQSIPVDEIEDQSSCNSTSSAPRDQARGKATWCAGFIVPDKPAPENVVPKNTVKNSKSSKKRNVEAKPDSDDEHLKRLQERRERKRAKKNIMKPCTDGDSEKENSPKPTRKRGKKDNHPESRTTFALMHGFTATNVGKNRITLEPLLRNVGVFKKGKASRTLKVVNGSTKKRAADNICFSEAQFLRKADANFTKSKNVISVSDSCSSSSTASEKAIPVNLTLAPASKKKDSDNVDEKLEQGSTCTKTRKTSEGIPDDKHRYYDPADSIVWDIERESYVNQSEPNKREGTITMTFPRDVLTREAKKGKEMTHEARSGCAGVGDNGPLPDLGLCETSDDSLHPSQSASKAREKKDNDRVTFSQYFAVGANRSDSLEDEADSPSFLLHMTSPQNEGSVLGGANLACRSQPRIEAQPATPTSCLTFPAGDTPCSYYAFSLTDVRSLFEDNGMEVDTYDAGTPHVESDPVFKLGQEHMAYQPGPIQYEGFLSPPIVEGRYLDFDDDIQIRHPSGINLTTYAEWPYQFGERDDAAPSDRHTYDEENPCYISQVSFTEDDPSLDDSPDLSGSTLDHEDVSLGPFPPYIDHFSQGRMLLYGLNSSSERVSDVEAEVAGLLKQNHWLPHRP